MSIPTIILSKVFEIEGIHALEISVRYDHSTNTVSEIENVWLKVNGQNIDAGDILFHFFEDGINTLIDNTDWRFVFREVINDNMSEAKEINPLAFAS